jgi:hypothetical protein
MLIDVDTIWFQSPEKLFEVSSYQHTGALFFRDRLLFESPGCGLNYEKVKYFIEDKAHISIDSSTASALADSSYFANKLPNLYSYTHYWRHGVNATEYTAQCHMQESSVVMINRNKLPKTIDLIKDLLPSFNLGYGDKEIYWIAATIAKEEFSWEPFIAGAYGDCGEIIHFDPRDPHASHIEPYFMNGQFLSEDISAVGKGLSERITMPLSATAHSANFELGEFNKTTSGRCGACKLMGCTPTPQHVNDEIVRMQTYQHANAPPKSGWDRELYYFLRRVKERLS